MSRWRRNERAAAAAAAAGGGERGSQVESPRSPAVSDEADMDLEAGPADSVRGESEPERTRSGARDSYQERELQAPPPLPRP